MILLIMLTIILRIAAEILRTIIIVTMHKVQVNMQHTLYHTVQARPDVAHAIVTLVAAKQQQPL